MSKDASWLRGREIKKMPSIEGLNKKTKDIIHTIRDEWINDAPQLIELLDEIFPREYLELIKNTKQYQELESAYPTHKKALATKVLFEHGISSLKNDCTIDFDSKNYIKTIWIKGLQARAIKVVSPLYNAIIFKEKLQKFIRDNQAEFNCTLLPKPEIIKIIPHVSCKKLHKEGRLKGALFDYKVKWWFFSKEDAERIATEKSDHIAKFKMRAEYKAHDRMVDDNIDYIRDLIHGWLSLRGYIHESINSSRGFYATHIENILNMPSVRQLVSAVPIREVGLPLDAKVYFETAFENEMSNNPIFSAQVTKELEKRELDYLEYNEK